MAEQDSAAAPLKMTVGSPGTGRTLVPGPMARHGAHGNGWFVHGDAADPFTGRQSLLVSSGERFDADEMIVSQLRAAGSKAVWVSSSPRALVAMGLPAGSQMMVPVRDLVELTDALLTALAQGPDVLVLDSVLELEGGESALQAVLAELDRLLASETKVIACTQDLPALVRRGLMGRFGSWMDLGGTPTSALEAVLGERTARGENFGRRQLEALLEAELSEAEFARTAIGVLRTGDQAPRAIARARDERPLTGLTASPRTLVLGQVTVAAMGNIALVGGEEPGRHGAALALAKDARQQGWAVQVHVHEGVAGHRWADGLADPSAVSFGSLLLRQGPAVRPRLVILERAEPADLQEQGMLQALADPNTAVLFVSETTQMLAAVLDFCRVRILTGRSGRQVARTLFGAEHAEHLELEAVGAGQALVMDTDLDAVMQTDL